MEKEEKILVLNVDRDNDIGRKAKQEGPIIGRENILKCANLLGLADPEDSDFNALFQAAKIYDEMKNKYKTEVAAILGHQNRGIDADKRLKEQLEEVLEKFKADYVLFVTDGADDEHVMPIVQSKVPILSVRRLHIKQAEQLESGYYKIKDFLEESLENPKFARLVFGLPAIALVLVAVFGIDGWRIIIGLIGIYLFVKGFKLESYILNTIEELRDSLTRKRFAFFMYMIGIAFFLLATYRGYTTMLEFLSIGIFETVASFISASIYFYFISGAGIWIARNVKDMSRSGRRVVAVVLFGFAIALVVYNATELIIKPALPFWNFVGSIIIGFVLMFIAVLLEWKW
ncbi:MAG: DUF373 family protein [Candidatus Aenigmarchaeota archaeon]|nr:DUF373 family protein [Candidatus Aenigmarchaeota archaeon]